LEKAGLAAEFAVEDLLEALAALALGKDEVVVFDGALRERGLRAGVADDVRGERAVRLEARVGLPEDLVRRHAALNGGEFARQEVVSDIKREDAAILVVIQDRGIGDSDVAIEQARSEGDLAFGIGEDFVVGPVERRGGN
jgi:hypothetical protein